MRSLIAFGEVLLEAATDGFRLCARAVLGTFYAVQFGTCWCVWTVLRRCMHNPEWRNPLLWIRWSGEDDALRWKRCRLCKQTYNRIACF